METAPVRLGAMFNENLKKIPGSHRERNIQDVVLTGWCDFLLNLHNSIYDIFIFFCIFS